MSTRTDSNPARGRPTRSRWILLGAAFATAAALSACGSGGDTTDAAPPPPAASLSISGTAAIGAPIVGQTVSIKCASGTGSAVTGSGGAYTVTIAAGAFPCVLQVPTGSGTLLTTATAGTGAGAVVNLTPATQLLLATLLASDPAASFTSFDATVAAKITAAAIATAQAQMVATMLKAGVDFTALGDLLAVAFSAAYDNVLDALATQLAASGSTLDALTTTIATAATPAPISVASDLLLKPSAANCDALRSTTYRVLKPANGATLEAQTEAMTVDAKTLQVAHGSTSTAGWVANGTCRYSELIGNYEADITVTPAGVLLARYTTDGGATYRDYLGFPEQTHTAAETAGTWNVIGMTRVTSTTYVASAGTLTFDNTGTLTGGTNCQNNATWAIDVCATLPASLFVGSLPLAADSAGGFDVIDPNTNTVASRLFAFAPGSGDLMLATVSAKGELFVQAKIENYPLPAVNSTTSSWNLDNTPAFVSASPLYLTSGTTLTVDPVSGTWTRSQSTNGGATRIETRIANNPRQGFAHRPQAVVADSNGAQVTVNELTTMYVPGTGFGPLVLPGTNPKLFELSGRAP